MRNYIKKVKNIDNIKYDLTLVIKCRKLRYGKLYQKSNEGLTMMINLAPVKGESTLEYFGKLRYLKQQLIKSRTEIKNKVNEIIQHRAKRPKSREVITDKVIQTANEAVRQSKPHSDEEYTAILERDRLIIRRSCSSDTLHLPKGVHTT